MRLAAFYPETVIRSGVMYASTTAWKIFIKPVLLNTAELKPYSYSLDGSVLQYFSTSSPSTRAAGEDPPLPNLGVTAK